MTKPLTKSDVYTSIAETTGLTKAQVASVFEALSRLIDRELNQGEKTDTTQVTIPGLCKIVTKYKPAQKERKGINPFTKEETIFKAKPASRQVKIRPLKALKDMVD